MYQIGPKWPKLLTLLERVASSHTQSQLVTHHYNYVNNLHKHLYQFYNPYQAHGGFQRAE